MPEKKPPTLLEQLESRQEDILKQLDDLNRRIETAVLQSRTQFGGESADSDNDRIVPSIN